MLRIRQVKITVNLSAGPADIKGKASQCCERNSFGESPGSLRNWLNGGAL